MAVGSTHAALRNAKMSSSFSVVRDANPEGMIFSNVWCRCSCRQS
ncbi:isopentenyl pyrophosphate isomerase [Staphylococcus gallinarum]|uniref:Isopentenyl pyrophosphate isomerase n=1 Tax=Staphylococcus gallinarum TaxID=1293 RepID=A0A380FKX4_STAGA|nr:isopentenyl pyrophosphate isomerase [Staphylococcus gallinarum]